MDLSPIIASIAKTENIAILILMIVCAFLCKVIVIIRKEDREDRAKQEERAIAAQTRNNVVLDKVADALTEIRIVMAAKGQR